MTGPAPGPAAARRKPPGDPRTWLSTAALLIALTALVVALAGSGDGEGPAPAAGTGPGSSPSPSPSSSASPSPSPSGTGDEPDADGGGDGRPTGVETGPLDPAPTGDAPTGAAVTDCPEPTVTVNDAESLQRALDEAGPGDSILLADGTYPGTFTASVPGTEQQPVFVCGGPGAVLDGEDIEGGYGFHLDGASHWRLIGFTVRNSQKGVMADRVTGAVIKGLTVQEIGDEAIHLRNFSSGNLVEGNTIRTTGLRREKFGEGIYIGSAESNWCSITDCEPDRSDHNIIRGNDIRDTTAESVDIKEGTTGGLVTGNTFDGARLTGGHSDSWVDVKGNDWVIENNTGTNSLEDGFQTHQVVDGWGTGNMFRGNTAHVNGPGHGFSLTPVEDNKVTCDNEVSGAAEGLANVDCSG
ncbi:right-handed parallel beta-helix repeat-containing protein [Streptomyces aidingensis]|uniref:Right handed beta helix region n=1 Tax=Streptomyces aidingensis TaxID=910347 RepID=A0A1I1Q3K0_9ACTN|nr:right-handed parallel beta-helix repeat-containing protein [Streptomyces aidingensis]SFD16711.1 Right handed beta helix region [Streptomyces aidingensis]